MPEPIVEGQPPAAVAENAEETKLLAMASAMDNGEALPVEGESKPDDKPAEKVEDKPPVEGEPKKDDKPVEEKPKGERQRGPDGKFLKADKPEEAKPDSEYSKAQKEEARQRGLLANFEKDKAKFREDTAKFAEEKRQIELARAQQRPEATLHGYTAREYLQASEDYSKSGDYENAYKARIAAAQVIAFEQQSFAQSSQKQSEAAFNQDMEAQLKDNADLRDPDTALSQAVSKVLEQYPEVYYLKGGFSKAVELAKRFMDADSLPDLRTKLEAAEAELKTLRKSTQPSLGGPSAPAGERKFEQLSTKEQEAYLQREAERLDQAA